MLPYANFQVLEFSDANICLALSNEYCSPEEVATLDRTKYLLGYLRHEDIHVQTIVIEHEYTDGDYLDDYASYYVKCFRHYDRRCKRVHFFAIEFFESEFVEIVRGSAPQERILAFKDAYRGFVVARPLPNAIIGRTALSTYSSGENRRHYPCTKKCSANLFGIELSVNSLEYQEQDTVLAACATVALWCCFHKTSEMFQTPVWSPATITRTANEVIHVSRPIPSHGLIVNQIHNAILRNGLVAEIFPPQVPLIPLLYGYLKSGLPVILGIHIEGKGLHAITLTGYSFHQAAAVSDSRPEPENSFIPFTASRIDKFFAHDDQIGPFSRIWVKRAKSEPSKVVFDGSWMTEDGRYRVMTPEVVIIPIYHKIRITFVDVQKWLPRLNWAMFSSSYEFPVNSPLEWDLYLTTTNEFKQDIRETYHAGNESLDRTLLSQHPRFIWRATLKSGNERLLELLADATDMSRSFPFYHVIACSEGLRASLRQLLDDPSLRSILEDTMTSPFVKFLRENL